MGPMACAASGMRNGGTTLDGTGAVHMLMVMQRDCVDICQAACEKSVEVECLHGHHSVNTMGLVCEVLSVKYSGSWYFGKRPSRRLICDHPSISVGPATGARHSRVIGNRHDR